MGFDEVVTLEKSRLRDREKDSGDGNGSRDNFSNALPRIIYASPEMEKLFGEVKVLACLDEAVLIEGETGTGKELLARAIHELGPRRGMSYVPVNCGAFSDGTFTAEFFGNEKGAYTGATRNKSGLALSANGGTLFLDEIDHTPMQVQAALLRFLDSHEIRAVGSTSTRKLDVRILTATNANLEKMVTEGRFLNDLLYRLRELPLTVPPLCARQEDITLLTDYFVEMINNEWGEKLSNAGLNGKGWKGPFSKLDDQVMDRLWTYSWPGNVRQLRDTLKYAALLSHINRGDQRITCYDIETAKKTTHQRYDPTEQEPPRVTERSDQSRSEEYFGKGPVAVDINRLVEYEGARSRHTLRTLHGKDFIQAERVGTQIIFFPNKYLAALAFRDLKAGGYEKLMGEIAAAERKKAT